MGAPFSLRGSLAKPSGALKTLRSSAAKRCYAAALNEPSQAHACIVRSTHAHGLLKGINTEAAKQMPGVLAIYTDADLEPYGPHKCALDFK